VRGKTDDDPNEELPSGRRDAASVMVEGGWAIGLNPWTQQLGVSWQRTLRFFERRYEVLQEFEGLGLLRQFDIREDRVAVRLGDANHELVFASNRLEAALLQPGAEIERLERAIRIVFKFLAPERLVRPEIRFQWLDRVEKDYDDARRSAAGALFKDGGSTFTDFALLLDGQIDEAGSIYTLECGIVDAAEAPARLARHAGRLSGRPSLIAPLPTVWRSESLPPVAFFCDTVWEPVRTLDTAPEGLFELWEGTRADATRVVLGIKDCFGLGGEDE
jgi:hypothetical protein